MGKLSIFMARNADESARLGITAKDPAEVIGDTSPNLPQPSAQGGGCGAMGMVIMIVVAVAATVVTAGAALLRRVLASASRAWGAALQVTGERLRAWHAPGGPLVGPWSTGLMALWTMLLLLALLVSGYFW